MRKGEAEKWADRELGQIAAEQGMAAPINNPSAEPSKPRFRTTADVREYYMQQVREGKIG